MLVAPEVIDNHRYTFGPDWWGLGCVVFEMIAGECPFRKRKERISRDIIEKRVRESSINYSTKFPPEASLFVSQVSVTEVMNHYDLLMSPTAPE